WSRKLYGLYGTGLAQPKRKPALEIRRRAGMMTEPSGSICTNGFGDRRPWSRAVGSPSQSAMKPWAISWRIIDMIRAMIIAIVTGSIVIKGYHISVGRRHSTPALDSHAPSVPQPLLTEAVHLLDKCIGYRLTLVTKGLAPCHGHGSPSHGVFARR